LAEWKFREFNELPHLFRERLNMSHPYATHYIDQFPKVKMEMISRAVAFIAGSLATVLALASLIDSENFLGFEITPDRTVLFYLGILGSIWAFARGSISEENTVFNPEFALRNVIEYTHYQPDHWQDRFHSFEVKVEFSELYKVKLMIFLEEILSILTTPFVLFLSLPRSSDYIIDFFREFTIHVDGLGYVCSFAEFDFKKGIAATKKSDGGAADVRDDYYSTKHGKMEASLFNFMGNYGNYALNPRTGVQAHLPPGMRHHFHPPPAWPSMNSPTLAADMSGSRMGRSENTRSRAPARTPHLGPVHAQLSPMASILLDPHHQPPTTSFARPRQPRAGYHDKGGIIEESLEDGAQGSTVPKHLEDEEPYGDDGALEESTWQTSPTKLSRENSGADARDGPDTGVVHMIYQFNQAQLNRRPGGGVR
jgi:autophagy-related protein 9